MIVAERTTTIGERRQNPERKLDTGYNITFEPGDHGNRGHIDQQQKKLLGGDSDAHMWNREVAARIIRYQPKIITVDGFFTLQPGQNKYEIDPVFKWIGLPAQPSKINRSGSVFSVNTDQFSSGLFDSDLQPADYDSQAISSQLLDLFEKEKQAGLDGHNAASTLLTKLLLHTMYFGLGKAGLDAYLRYENEEAPTPVTTNTAKRRTLLRAGGLTAVASMAVGVDGVIDDLIQGAQEVRAVERSKRDLDLLVKVTYAATPEERARVVAEYDAVFSDVTSQWVQARNALYVLKTMGAYDRLGLERSVPAAIIAGTGHLKGFTNILHDEAYAQQALRDFVAGLFVLVDEHYRKPLPKGVSHSLSPAQVKSMLVNLISLTSIDEVRDPDPVAFKQNPTKAIKTATKQVAIYQDPRVIEALAPLLV